MAASGLVLRQRDTCWARDLFDAVAHARPVGTVPAVAAAASAPVVALHLSLADLEIVYLVYCSAHRLQTVACWLHLFAVEVALLVGMMSARRT